MGTCDCCGRDDLMNDGTCCDCCDKAVGVGLSELRRRKDSDRFTKFITELSQNIAGYSCGCMGSGYTLEKVKKEMQDGDTSYEFITDVFDKYYHR
jgi:hypothetical protein